MSDNSSTQSKGFEFSEILDLVKNVEFNPSTHNQFIQDYLGQVEFKTQKNSVPLRQINSNPDETLKNQSKDYFQDIFYWLMHVVQIPNQTAFSNIIQFYKHMLIHQMKMEPKSSWNIKIVLEILKSNAIVSNESFVRANCLDCVGQFLTTFDINSPISEDNWLNIQTHILNRFSDKVPQVRIEALKAASRLQDPKNRDCPIQQKIIHLAYTDSSPKVRAIACKSLAVTRLNLQVFLKKLDDCSSVVRASALTRIQYRAGWRRLSTQDCIQIAKMFSSETDEAVSTQFLTMFAQDWFQKGCQGKLIDFVSKLEPVNNYEIVEMMVLKLLLVAHSSKYDILSPKDMNISWISSNLVSPLDENKAFVWRMYLQFLYEYDQYSNFSLGFVDNKSINPSAQEYFQQMDLQPLHSLQDFLFNISDFASSLSKYYVVEKNDFILIELLKIAFVCDFSDELGRASLISHCMVILQEYFGIVSSSIKELGNFHDFSDHTSNISTSLTPTKSWSPASKLNQGLSDNSSLSNSNWVSATPAKSFLRKATTVAHKTTKPFSSEAQLIKNITLISNDQHSVKFWVARLLMALYVDPIEKSSKIASIIQSPFEYIESQSFLSTWNSIESKASSLKTNISDLIALETESKNIQLLKSQLAQVMTRLNKIEKIVLNQKMASLGLIHTFLQFPINIQGPQWKNIYQNIVVSCLSENNPSLRLWGIHAMGLFGMKNIDIARKTLITLNKVALFDTIELVQIEAIKSLGDILVAHPASALDGAYSLEMAATLENQMRVCGTGGLAEMEQLYNKDIQKESNSVLFTVLSSLLQLGLSIDQFKHNTSTTPQPLSPLFHILAKCFAKLALFKVCILPASIHLIGLAFIDSHRDDFENSKDLKKQYAIFFQLFVAQSLTNKLVLARSFGNIFHDAITFGIENKKNKSSPWSKISFFPICDFFFLCMDIDSPSKITKLDPNVLPSEIQHNSHWFVLKWFMVDYLLKNISKKRIVTIITRCMANLNLKPVEENQYSLVEKDCEWLLSKDLVKAVSGQKSWINYTKKFYQYVETLKKQVQVIND